MRFAPVLVALAVAACTGPGASPSEPVPEGTWRGTLVSLDGAGRPLPATLTIRSEAVSFVAGSARANGSEAAVRGGRLAFAVDRFPITPTLYRTLRCTLARDGARAWDGTCRGGTATYALRLEQTGG